MKAVNSDEPSSPVAVEEPKKGGNDKKDLHIGNESDANPSSELDDGEAEEEREKRQEMDWKIDEEFKNFMGNPSIEAAIKLEKKRADRKLKEIDRERSNNPLIGIFNKLARDNLSKEKERLEKAEETFKALDLNKVLNILFWSLCEFWLCIDYICKCCLVGCDLQLKSCFGFDTFFATDVRRFGDGGIFIGNLRKPIDEAIPKLEKKLSEAAGREVVVWLMEEKTNEITKQVFQGLSCIYI